MQDAASYYSLKGKSILLATDGRSGSEKAMWVAFNLAKILDSRLYILLVVALSGSAKERSLQVKESKKKMNDIIGLAADNDVDIVPLLESGSPYETIINAIAKLGVSAVIVGTSEKSALNRVLIGSVSEHVVRNSPCTVVVVK